MKKKKIPLTPKQEDFVTTLDSFIAAFPWKRKHIPMDVVTDMRDRLYAIGINGYYYDSDSQWLNILRQEYINTKQKSGNNNV